MSHDPQEPEAAVVDDAGVLAVARAAFDCLRDGFETGNFEPFIDMLTDDFTFWMPAGPFRGRNIGKDLAASNYRGIAKAPGTHIRLDTPWRTTSTGTTVVFELEDGGTIMGRPFTNRVAFSIDVRGRKISGLREYVGDVDPELFSMAASVNEEPTHSEAMGSRS